MSRSMIMAGAAVVALTAGVMQAAGAAEMEMAKGAARPLRLPRPTGR